jgi:hypothetical protein
VRWLWWLLAYASLGLGIVGIAVPGLPTVPFVLLAATGSAIMAAVALWLWRRPEPRQ